MSSSELDRLIDAWLRGTLSADELAALESELRRNPAARQRHRRTANLDTALRDWATRDRITAAWSVPAAVPAPRLGMWWAVGLAASVAVGSLWWASTRPPETVLVAEQTDQGCAVLTQVVGATWADDQISRRRGDTLRPGSLRLEGGLAQIEFFSGATVLLEGPAEVEIVSPWEAVCHEGKARVRVPPAAHGFTWHTPAMKLVDLGTEFGVEVNRHQQLARVEVFDGEVEAHPNSGAAVINLKGGQALQARAGGVERIPARSASGFADAERVRQLSRAHAQDRFAAWSAHSEQLRQDARLIAYYPFTRSASWDRLLHNTALAERNGRDGGAVGATWAEGRWPQKSALEFKRAGDRVRLQLDGTYEALTFACWVKVDGLDRKYNSLLLTDGYDDGEPHWQIYEDGSLMFSIMYSVPGMKRGATNQMYFSRPVFDASTTGRWHHVAVTYENRTGEVVQYFDGQEVGREISALHQSGRPIVYGPCEIGNWGLPTPNHSFPVRNLNGRLDEFAIFSVALSAGEIRAMYEAGRNE